MNRPSSIKNTCRGRRGERGQAMVEYGIVLALTTIVLIAVATEPSVIDDIVQQVKAFFQAFAYAMSIPAQDAF